MQSMLGKREEKLSVPDSELVSVLGEPLGRNCRSWIDDQKLLPMLPYYHENAKYGLQPMFLNNMGLADPGTPAYTPPIQYPLSYQPPPFVDDSMCFYPNIRPAPEPLDWRPMHSSMAGTDDWKRPDYVPKSCSSGSSAVSPRINSNGNNSGYSTCDEEKYLKDDVLLSLSARELKIKMQGYRQEEIERFRKRSKMLKASEYRKKRKAKQLQQQRDLEIAHRKLQEELDRTKVDLARATQERDILKHNVHTNGHAPPGPPIQNLYSFNNQTKANFYP